MPKTLILGWGNPGRSDDGLGPALARIVADRSIDGLTVDTDYQLQIEDAADVARYDRVVFVDADRTGPEPFSCRPLEPAESGLSFSSHSVSPAALLALTRDLFHRQPEAWLVGIRGYEFDELRESLSSRARENLSATAMYMAWALRSGELTQVPPAEPSTLSDEVGHEC
jgi:hydrogenase maturation protease